MNGELSENAAGQSDRFRAYLWVLLIFAWNTDRSDPSDGYVSSLFVMGTAAHRGAEKPSASLNESGRPLHEGTGDERTP